MKILVSTFGKGDAHKVMLAMRALPYDRLVLIGDRSAEGCNDHDRIRRMEEMAGHAVEFVSVEDTGFMELVDEIANVLTRCAQDRRPGHENDVVLNISGGSKLLGDAALLAAFRLGIECYHCDHSVIKMPVVKGATAKDRFTPAQVELVVSIAEDEISLAGLAERMKPASRQAVERVVRELRKQGLLEATVRNGEVLLRLSPQGLEVLKAIGSAARPHGHRSMSSPPSKTSCAAE